MLGALAWQATTVIKMILVSWGEIARGLFYLSPGFSPLCLVSLVVCLPSQPIRRPGTTFYRREFVMELPTKHQSCTMVCMEALKKHGCLLLGLFGVSSGSCSYLCAVKLCRLRCVLQNRFQLLGNIFRCTPVHTARIFMSEVAYYFSSSDEQVSAELLNIIIWKLLSSGLGICIDSKLVVVVDVIF